MMVVGKLGGEIDKRAAAVTWASDLIGDPLK
jgi:hypothetical protein